MQPCWFSLYNEELKKKKKKWLMTLQKLVPHAGLVPYQGHSQPDTKWQPLQVHFQDFQMLIFNKLDRGLGAGIAC